MNSDILRDIAAHWADGYLYACRTIGGKEGREAASYLKGDLLKRVHRLRSAEKRLHRAVVKARGNHD